MINRFLNVMPAKDPRLPLQVPAAPPLALAFSSDPAGVELSVVATRATLDAMGLLVKDLPKLMAKPPATPPQRQE